MPDSNESPSFDCDELPELIDEATDELAQAQFDRLNAEAKLDAATAAHQQAFKDWEAAAEARNANSKAMADAADHAYDETSIIIGKPRYTPAFNALAKKQPALDQAAKDAWDKVEQSRRDEDAARAALRECEALVADLEDLLRQLEAAAAECGESFIVVDPTTTIWQKVMVLVLVAGTVLGGVLLAGRAFAGVKEPADHSVVPSGPSGPRTDDPSRSVAPRTTTSEEPTTTTSSPKVEEPKTSWSKLPHSTPGVTPGVNVIITPQPLPTERIVPPSPTKTIHEPTPIGMTTPTSTTMPRETQPTTTSTTCPKPTQPIG